MRLIGCFILCAGALQAQFGELVLVTAGAAPVQPEEALALGSVLSREELESRKLTSVDEAIRQTLSAIVLRNGSPGKVASLFLRGTESDHTLLLVDGVPVHNASFGGVNYGDLLTEGMERIEVIRGPYSALYGSEAVGGVVALFTHRSPQPGGRIALSAGGEGLVHGDLEWHIGDLSVSFARHVESGRLDNDDWRQIQARAAWQAEAWGISVFARDGEQGIPFDGATATPQRRTRNQEITLSLPVATPLGSAWSLQGLAAFTASRFHFEDPQDPWGYTESDTDTNRAFARLMVQRPWKGWTLSAGVEGRHETVDDASALGTNLDGEASSGGAAFAETAGTLGPATVRVGVRWDSHSDYGSTINPKVGLSLPYGPVRFHLQVGTAFRAPSAGELHFPFSGNPDLNPERSRSMEAGLTAGPFIVNVFRNDFDDLIEFDYAAYRFQNTGEARILGVETRWTQRWGRTALDLNATWLDTENRPTGTPLLRRPRWAGSWSLSYPGKLLGISVQGIYAGKRWDVNPITFSRALNQAFYRQDLALSLEKPEWLSPWLKVENLFNAAYEEVLGYPALGRRFSVGISVRW